MAELRQAILPKTHYCCCTCNANTTLMSYGAREYDATVIQHALQDAQHPETAELLDLIPFYMPRI